MTISVWHAIAIFAVTAVMTWVTRAVPFVIFGKRKEIPKFITYLGKALPGAIMATLVIYCLKSINLTEFPFGLAELISVAVLSSFTCGEKISSGALPAAHSAT